jgi:hypothetical protein
VRFSIFEKAKEHEDQYKKIFGCEAGSLPFRYLGIPIHIENYSIKYGTQ